MYGAPFNRYQLQVAIRAYTPRMSWTSGNHLAVQQHISIWNTPRMTGSSIEGACLDYALFATRLRYVTNTLFSSSFLSHSFFLGLHFCGYSPKKLFLYKCLLTGNTLFFGDEFDI